MIAELTGRLGWLKIESLFLRLVNLMSLRIWRPRINLQFVDPNSTQGVQFTHRNDTVLGLLWQTETVSQPASFYQWEIF